MTTLPLEIDPAEARRMTFRRMGLLRAGYFEAYAAGIIDGEGSIGIALGTFQTYYMRVTVPQALPGKPMLEAFHGYWGGNIYPLSLATATHAEKWQWHVGGHAGAAFLRDIRDHLILKRDHADIAIEFTERCTQPKRGGKWSPLKREIGRELREILMGLNQRGPAIRIKVDWRARLRAITGEEEMA